MHPPPGLIAAAVRLLAATWRVVRVGREELDAALADGPVVFAFRHGEQLAVLGTHAGLPVTALASRSRDGELAARVIERLGFEAIRGSSSRGGLAALAAGRRVLRGGRSLALTVDGPRGPAGEPKPGAAALSRMARAPLCWVKVEVSRAVRLKSWDRFLIPLPFARITVRTGVLPPTQDVEAGTDALRRALVDGRGLLEASE